MNQDAKQGIQVFRQSHEFLSTSKPTTAHGPVTTQTEELKGITDRLTSFGAEQDESERAFRGLTAVAHAQAKSLRFELMRPISRLAGRIFPSEPQLLRALEMPRSRDYEQLIAAGNAFIAVVEQHKEMFISAGFAQDFLTTLKTAIDELRTTLDARAVQRGRRRAATAGAHQELMSGKALLRMLDDMIGPPLSSDHSRYAKWKTLSRFARSTRDRSSVAPTEPGTAGSISPPTDAGHPTTVSSTPVPVAEAA